MARPDACDFVFANPHDVASAEYVASLIEATRPTGPPPTSPTRSTTRQRRSPSLPGCVIGSGATAVTGARHSTAFDLPVETIAAALTPRTRAIIVNSPHNSTGRIYPDESLAALADVLGRASRQQGRTI